MLLIALFLRVDWLLRRLLLLLILPLLYLLLEVVQVVEEPVVEQRRVELALEVVRERRGSLFGSRLVLFPFLGLFDVAVVTQGSLEWGLTN